MHESDQTPFSFHLVDRTAASGLEVTDKVAMLRAEGVALRRAKAGSWVVKSVDEEGGKAVWDWTEKLDG